MAAYIARRLAQAIPTLFGLTIIVFLMLRLLPGDPAKALLPPGAPEEDLIEMRRSLRLDGPLPVQYAAWMFNVVQGDLGTSFSSRQPVTMELATRLPSTIRLALVSIALSILIGIPVGLLSALRPGSIFDYLGRIFALAGFAIPNFWLAIMLILVFAVWMRILPTSGRGTWRHYVLPSVTLATYLVAILASMMRSTAIEVLRENYVRTARAKGLAERTVVYRHVLKNTFIAVITVIGLQIGGILGGAVVIETVFGWPGVGLLTFDAVSRRDYPVIQAAALLSAVAFVVINLVVDVLYAFIDPRIQYP